MTIMSLTDHFSTIDACRFCFMCRHVCTTGVVTGRESDTPRGRALVLFKILKGHTEWSDELIDAVYRCCLCGLCETWCQADSSPPDAILEARRAIVAGGRAPQMVARVRERLLAEGNPLGLPRNERFKAIHVGDALGRNADVLYYVGCDTAYRRPEIANALLKILRASGVDVAILADEHSTGKPLELLGYREDARAMSQSLMDMIRASGCKTVVTTCPSSLDALTRDFTALGLDTSSVEMLHATAYVERLVTEGRLPQLRPTSAVVTPLDDTYLGRRHGLFDAPRRLLGTIPGLVLREMTWSRELAYACGEPGGVFGLLHPELSVRLAQRVWGEATRTGADTLATCCPVVKEVLSQSAPGQMVVSDVVELVADALDTRS